MRDQATALRLVTDREPPPALTLAGPPAIVIGSGKGGVGKSLIATLLAAAVARSGQRVLLLDGDQTLANLHVLLGVRPTGRLEDVLRGQLEPEELVLPVMENLWLLPSDSGAEGLYGLTATDRARLHYRLSGLYDDYDAVIIDGGAGIESVVRSSLMRASRLIVVTIPEPAALTDAYALIKTATTQIPNLPIDVLVNRTADPAEGRMAFDKLAEASDRFLGLTVGDLGALPEDPAVRALVCDPARLLSATPDSAAAEQLHQFALTLLPPPDAGADPKGS